MSKKINWDELPIIKARVGVLLKEYFKHDKSSIFLDVGGTDEYWKKHTLPEGWIKILLNFDKEKNKGICGDICMAPIKDNSIDVVFSRNVFEHIKEPWIAAEECVRITKPNGLLIHRTPFGWRYHACPIDYYRYSHEGLAYLFERTGEVERIDIGYCGGRLSKRKNRNRKKYISNLNYWLENWISIYIGRKIK